MAGADLGQAIFTNLGKGPRAAPHSLHTPGPRLNGDLPRCVSFIDLSFVYFGAYSYRFHVVTRCLLTSSSTGRMGWMAHRKWKEAKQLTGTAGPGNMLGCSLISFHFLWAIHPICPVHLNLVQTFNLC